MSNSTNQNRVAITGLGVVSSLGQNINDFWNNLVQGKSGVKSLNDSDRFQDDLPFEYPIQIASYVSDFNLSPDILSEKEQGRFDLFTHYALHATNDALEQAKLKNFSEVYAPHRVGSILGIGMGGFPIVEQEHRTPVSCG